MSDIRFNSWYHQSGTGGVVQDGSGNVGIGSTIPATKLDVGGNIDVTGSIKVGSAASITATEFYGGGGNLTGIDATAIQKGTTKIQTETARIEQKVSNVGIVTITSAGINVTGIVTANSYRGDGSALTGIPVVTASKV